MQTLLKSSVGKVPKMNTERNTNVTCVMHLSILRIAGDVNMSSTGAASHRQLRVSRRLQREGDEIKAVELACTGSIKNKESADQEGNGKKRISTPVTERVTGTAHDWLSPGGLHLLGEGEPGTLTWATGVLVDGAAVSRTHAREL